MIILANEGVYNFTSICTNKVGKFGHVIRRFQILIMFFLVISDCPEIKPHKERSYWEYSTNY